MYGHKVAMAAAVVAVCWNACPAWAQDTSAVERVTGAGKPALAPGSTPASPGGPAPRGPGGADQCTAALPINGSGMTATSTTGATNTPSDSAGACGGSATTPDVWFNYHPAATGQVTFRFCAPGGSASYDTVLEAYTNCPTMGGARIVCNDDFCGLQSQIIISAVLGNVYKIRVSGFNQATGTGVLIYEAAGTAPPNDTCMGALPLSIGGTVTGSTAAATADNALPCGAARENQGPGVWYRVVGGSGLNLTASLCAGTNFDSKLSVYCGGCSSLNCVAGDDDGCGGVGVASTVSWCSQSGQNYFLLVHGYHGATGSFSLTLTPGGACNPIDCHSCQVGLPAFVREENEPCGGNTNGGCNSGQPPQPFMTPIAVGDMVHGTAWADNGMRDTDWYLLTLDRTRHFGVQLRAKFPAVSFIIAYADLNTCSGATFPPGALMDPAPCATGTYEATLPPGQYALFVAVGDVGGAATFNGVPCDGINNDYVLIVQDLDEYACPPSPPPPPSCPCDWNHDGRINSQDFFDFVSDFFANHADFNMNGITNSQDFFDFVTCFFNPPPACNGGAPAEVCLLGSGEVLFSTDGLGDFNVPLRYAFDLGCGTPEPGPYQTGRDININLTCFQYQRADFEIGIIKVRQRLDRPSTAWITNVQATPSGQFMSGTVVVQAFVRIDLVGVPPFPLILDTGTQPIQLMSFPISTLNPSSLEFFSAGTPSLFTSTTTTPVGTFAAAHMTGLCTNIRHHTCPDPLPAGCMTDCPTGAMVAHTANIRIPAAPPGRRNGTYGSRYTYTFVPASNYCVEIREVITPGVDNCNCFGKGIQVTDSMNLKCDAASVDDSITNSINPAAPPPRGCTSVNTQQLQCRAKGSNAAWVTFATHTHTFRRLGAAEAGAGNFETSVTPMGGAPVVSPQIPYP